MLASPVAAQRIAPVGVHRSATIPSTPAPPADQIRELTRRDYARIAAQGFVLGAALGALEAFLVQHYIFPTAKESNTYKFYMGIMAPAIAIEAVVVASRRDHSSLGAIPSSP